MQTQQYRVMIWNDKDRINSKESKPNIDIQIIAITEDEAIKIVMVKEGVSKFYAEIHWWNNNKDICQKYQDSKRIN